MTDLDIKSIQDGLNNIRKILENGIGDNGVKFNPKDGFPGTRGIYIINQGKEVVYVGSAAGKKRSIQKRCKQHISLKDTGATLRKNVENAEGLSPQEAIDFIKEKFKARFIEMNNDDERDIRMFESLCICAFNPKYNK